MKRSTSILLGIIALALVVIAVNTMGPEAEAQPQVSIAPSLVHAFTTEGRMIRVWSDGLIEWRGYQTSCNVTGFAGFNTPEWLEVVDCP